MRWDYGTIYKKLRKSKHISQEEVCAVVKTKSLCTIDLTRLKQLIKLK